MKIILTLLFCIFISGHCKAQMYDTATIKRQIKELQVATYNAGHYLQKYHSQVTTGTFIALGGAILAGIGAGAGESGLAIMGGAVTMVGGVVALGASGHIKRAGIQLRSNGVVIPIKNNKELKKK